jgi:predicted Zn-dependent protease
MNRDLQDLQVEGAPTPYHIGYKITEVEVNDAVASLGYTTTRKARHTVSLEVRVRVGIPPDPMALDNANFVFPGGDGVDGVAGRTLPLDATPEFARRAAWLATDEAYKEALMQLQAKLDARRSGSGGNGLPSWTKEAAIVDEEPVLVPELESLDKVEDRAKKLSGEFRDNPAIRDSRVAVTSYLERRWYLNSDGTNVTDTRRVSGVLISASSQADDGQELTQYFLRYGQTAKDLPSDDELTSESKRLISTLEALRKAPVVDPYSGPVLFEGEGAVGIVRNSLAPHLGGTPLPEGLRPQEVRPQEAKQFGGALTGKVGLRATSTILSIIDDPTSSTEAGKAVIGGYRIDDEGVAAQKVQVVKAGMLASLLTTRTPSAKGATSNGHARRVADGGMFFGTATNLVVSAKGGQTHKALVAKLLAAAKGEGLKYGIIIRQLDDSAVTATPELSRREMYQAASTADLDLPPPASLVYKVYADGREELVRGAQLGEIPIRSWKDVIAAGKTQTVYNFLASPQSYLADKFGGGADDGAVPSTGIESSITTPDLLFKEMDITPITVKRAEPAVPSPIDKK